MNCYKCKKIIDKMHNDCINNNELQSVLHHIQNCKSCAMYYSVMEQMLNDLSTIEEQELPKGFHNKLHFALQREVEKPVKAKRGFSTAVKVAAIGACSILLVTAVISILPRQKMMDAMPNMAMEQAAEEPETEGIMKSDMASLEEAELHESKEFSSADGVETRDETDNEMSEDNAKAESEVACGYFEHGSSTVLILDVENIDEAYETLIEYFPNPLPDSSWVIGDIKEPSEYRQIRAIMSLPEAQHIGDKIALEYVYDMDYYAEVLLEYDNYDEEIADLQNIGYVYIVLK